MATRTVSKFNPEMYTVVMLCFEKYTVPATASSMGVI